LQIVQTGISRYLYTQIYIHFLQEPLEETRVLVSNNEVALRKVTKL
jgi:hypothetical protein